MAEIPKSGEDPIGTAIREVCELLVVRQFYSLEQLGDFLIARGTSIKIEGKADTFLNKFRAREG